ncbi:MAG: transcription factor TFIIB [Crenarchaeota archaeon]|nr:MAG: transcription factor TFIIB [Thermoproteota archaeon]RDJ33081.1 MAG: transcription factor TFIIB [Thermoproteota archaeon]RDJ36415.1 MAG: transcription factor TFIIB [Thermoproteota archaeon]RDJ39044.1 MAG: transcription factor TFIIB [Thermoproteota archaeon]
MKSIVVQKCLTNKHASIVTDETNGEIICSDCGYVLKERIADFSHQEKAYSDGKTSAKARTGSPSRISIPDMGISSTISQKNVDASGNRLSHSTKKRFHRLRMWDFRSKNAGKKRSLSKAFAHLDSLKPKLGLPDSVIEKTATIYRKASSRGLIRGKSIPVMMASSIYVACRLSGIPRSVDEIAKASNVTRRYLIRSYKRLVSYLNISLEHPGCIDYLGKIASKVGASEKSQRLALKILQDVIKDRIVQGKNPLGLAAGAIYLSCAANNEKISYPKLEKKCNVSAVTIRKNTSMFRKYAAKYVDSIEV